MSSESIVPNPTPPVETPSQKIDRLKTKISRIEPAAVQQLIRELVEPNWLNNKRVDKSVYGLSDTSFTDVCDGLEIDLVSRKKMRGRSVLVKGKQKVNRFSAFWQKKVNHNLFAPKAGDEITVIRVAEDMSLVELRQLVDTIIDLSESPLHQQDKEKIEAWKARLGEYSHNLQWAAVAMLEVQQQAMEGEEETEFDQIYTESAKLVYRLGQAIDVDRTKTGTLEEEYQLVKAQIDQDHQPTIKNLEQGLQYARFGDSPQGKKKQPTSDRMAKLYHKIKKFRQSNPEIDPVYQIINQTINTVLDQSLPQHINQVRPETVGQVENFIHALSVRSIEMLYQKLPIPQWIKDFVGAEVDDPEQVYKYIEIINQEMRGVGANNILQQFAPNPQDYNSTQLLKAYQQHLRTLGLGQENIEHFNDWLEDPNFLTPNKIEALKQGLAKQKFMDSPPPADQPFSWEETDKPPKSIAKATQYYQNKLETSLENQKQAILDEWTRFQQAVVVMAINQMRTNYNGWVDKDTQPFVDLLDTSPSAIIHRQQLNCAGRTLVMLRVTGLLSIPSENVFGAFKLRHTTTSIKFANQQLYLIENTANSGLEICSTTPITDFPPSLLRSDEQVVQDHDQPYLLTPAKQTVISGILTNYAVYTNNSLEIKYLYKQNRLDSTDIANFFIEQSDTDHTTISQISQHTGLSLQEINWLLQRLLALEPDYWHSDRQNDILSRFRNQAKFQNMMDTLFRQMKEKPKTQIQYFLFS
ncbi:hypothetical protein DRH14_01565 [Candidatus Shapirobacteria bacterium]|nr:MAG: hypothetical protein DRH14_01565 [Candidatus Shapirobacteria bacterium]